MTIDPMELRQAFGSFMTGVTIVTAKTRNGDPVGFTANSFTSVSLDPPLLLVCPGNHLSSIEAFRTCQHFAINILSDEQQELANTFARSKGERFSDANWHADAFGSPLMQGGIASFSCSIHDRKEAGDHLIMIGKVEGFESTSGMGLGYWKGGYFSLRNERQAGLSPNPSERVVAGALIESGKEIFVQLSDGKLRLPSTEIKNKTQARAGIDEHLKRQGLSASIGRVYSLFSDPKEAVRYIYFRCEALSEEMPDDDAGQFMNLHEAASGSWADTSEQAIVRRYLLERETNQFGLYVGDQDTGEVHHEKFN